LLGNLRGALAALCRYVYASNGRFTPQTLPGRGGLDARHGLTLMLCAQRLELKLNL
jgi:hypothetical protein